MNSADAASLVDSFVGDDGEPVVITRRIDTTTTELFSCIAFVREYRANELGNGIIQGDTQVTISGSVLAALPAPAPRKNDKILIQGRQRNVEAVAPIAIGGELVRIDLTVRG